LTVNGKFTRVENVNAPFTRKEDRMENIKLTIRAIAANEKISIEELAKRCDISPAHLKQVSAGNVRMLAEDLKKISTYTGIPADNIIAC
jgi:transcriptional regulator with XRE-family HTH domain